jgi:hypothetical protein
VLTAQEVERFITDGFVCLPEAFPRALAGECRAFLWRETGLDPADPATWTRAVVRLDGYGGGLFSAAASTPPLHEAFDQLVGPGGASRAVLAGTPGSSPWSRSQPAALALTG